MITVTCQMHSTLTKIQNCGIFAASEKTTLLSKAFHGVPVLSLVNSSIVDLSYFRPSSFMHNNVIKKQVVNQFVINLNGNEQKLVLLSTMRSHG